MAVEVSESWDSESLDKLSPYGLERLSFELASGGDQLARSRKYGAYKCARCMNDIYHSRDKFVPLDAAAAQWPTFRAPADSERSIRTRRTYSFGLKRTEVLCKKCGLHLGHVYPDGKECGDKKEGAGERHCILSVAVSFEAQENPNPEEEEEEEEEPEPLPVPEKIEEKREAREGASPSRAAVRVVAASRSPFKTAVSGARTKELLKDASILDRASQVGIASPARGSRADRAAAAQKMKDAATTVDKEVTGKTLEEPAAAASSGGMGWGLKIGIPLVIIAAAVAARVAMTKSQQQ